MDDVVKSLLKFPWWFKSFFVCFLLIVLATTGRKINRKQMCYDRRIFDLKKIFSVKNKSIICELEQKMLFGWFCCKISCKSRQNTTGYSIKFSYRYIKFGTVFSVSQFWTFLLKFVYLFRSNALQLWPLAFYFLGKASYIKITSC